MNTPTARQQTVMATVADSIVAAATGKTLRVAVGYTHPDGTAFADHLTRALHARGRSCHCRPAKPKSTMAAGCMPAHNQAGGVTVAVITSGACGPDETDVCRINLQLHTPAGVVASIASAQREPDGRDLGTGGT
jgi:hypothetical protein